MTPPTTPNGSQEDLIALSNVQRPVFHNFLRAFYPFHPNYAMGDSTVTLPLSEGDVVLVHSIHTNGWADGTLLVSGARGWLPTNYCEAYDPDEMRNLLKALLNFWDLLRSTSTNDRDIFGNQEFMKGIIAGVRFLLERTHCLTRESPTIQRNESLRRGRKSLLSELSALVKTAKRLQETLRGFPRREEDVNDTIDEMILKAFKIIVKGVRFLDLLEEDRRQRAPPAVTVMATVVEESYIPPTPPAESNGVEQGQGDREDAGIRGAEEVRRAESVASHHISADGVQTSTAANKRLSSIYSRTNTTGHPTSQLSPSHGNRLSASISHRVSLAGPSPLSHPQNLVSERLNSSHDTFLSYLGSFIGRLHLQSQSRADLALAIKQSATSGGELFAVVDTVCRHNSLGSESLDQARAAMYDRIRDLVYSARDILSNVGPDADDVIMPQDNSCLLMAATGCVKAAGECVAKTKWVIERIGDFEFESENGNLGIDLALFEKVSESRPTTPEQKIVTDPKPAGPSPTPVSKSMHLSMDKPLPEVPGDDEFPEQQDSEQHSPPASRPQSLVIDDATSSMASSVSSIRPILPPLPKLTTSLLLDDSYSPTTEDSHDSEYQNSYRADTMTASSTGTNSTYLSRDSESSLVSQTSTRATTPDHALGPKYQPSLSELSATGSSAGTEEVDDVESKLLEKTFAHELMFNKEGQVTGGSLPALVERLTTHESTPDAVFVSAFYLTFRLFCTPTKLAETLIDRFDYVGEAPHVANPVRLRVYNVMKGWLESHWRESTDHEAIPIIQHFAEVKLSSLLPSAGKRLLELAHRVSSSDGSLVPRLVSSMGKTNTSISQYVPADTPLPNPIMSKSQHHLLSNWKAGGSMPSVLDFEPLEVARQLTLKQMIIFCSILPEELLGSQWMKKGGADSPNVKAMSGLSTDLSNLVADTILQYPEVKKRAAVIKQWIKVAYQCLELNNYDGLMAIICSLNSSIISRLRKTWDIVSPRRKEMLKSLQAIVEPSQNNKVLRARLQGHVPPCLPFLGMFLTDLTFVDIGNPATKQLPGASSEDHGLTVVNFDKHSRTAKIIGELQRFQIRYRLTEVPELQEWMQAQIVRLKESDQGNVQVSYYRKSLLLEPREQALRTAVEPTTVNNHNNQKADLFGWMSRDRGHGNTVVPL
ncbi:RasGEF domain-containing protein [Pseudomassariella vexata]|uniref:RasGEF domain-containing protein n=1 Tax=Pseudomassariella vexata TaxID=1141098 RepID=A0A1Y2E0C2_9PEZI|nr:RasGEF domain-containing protein [Pseudomassariella vexata]ORY64315.1 RasGEF domain-containing protein [Pseudomassariella vexata]